VNIRMKVSINAKIAPINAPGIEIVYPKWP